MNTKPTPTQPPCSICGEPIDVVHGWKGGHNAQPINNGRCCSRCNNNVVLPTRLSLIMEDRSDAL